MVIKPSENGIKLFLYCVFIGASSLYFHLFYMYYITMYQNLTDSKEVHECNLDKYQDEI